MVVCGAHGAATSIQWNNAENDVTVISSAREGSSHSRSAKQKSLADEAIDNK